MRRRFIPLSGLTAAVFAILSLGQATPASAQTDDAEAIKRVLIDMWDAMRAADDPLAVLGAASFEQLEFPTIGAVDELEHRIVRRNLSEGLRTFSIGEWGSFHDRARRELIRLTWRSFQHFCCCPRHGDRHRRPK